MKQRKDWDGDKLGKMWEENTERRGKETLRQREKKL